MAAGRGGGEAAAVSALPVAWGFRSSDRFARYTPARNKAAERNEVVLQLLREAGPAQ